MVHLSKIDLSLRAGQALIRGVIISPRGLSGKVAGKFTHFGAIWRLIYAGGGRLTPRG